MSENNRRWIVTLIPADNDFIGNEYVKGRISALLEFCCLNSDDPRISMGYLKRYSRPNGEFGYVFQCYTTEELYHEASVVIDLWYPGVCRFDIPVDDDYCVFAESSYDGDACCLGNVISECDEEAWDKRCDGFV